MNTVCKLGQQEYQLFRFPKGQHDKSLQAWDGGDEYLATHLIEQFPNIDNSKHVSLLIMNDQFGALSVFLNHLTPTVLTDSYISQRAIEQNSHTNTLASPQVINSLSALPIVDVIALKLTKNLGYLEYQLQQISKLSSSCRIIAVGKTTLVTTNLLKLFERYFPDTSTSLAKKKHRLIFAQHDGIHSTQNKSLYTTFPKSVSWPEKNLVLKSHANVFSKDQVDIGGRFLAENLPTIYNEQSVIDLGCGNGLLGLSLLQKYQNKSFELTFVDESYMAVQSAKLNVEEQFPNTMINCSFVQDDCLTQQTAKSVDIILCNPPFHQQNTITEHIAKQMFTQALDVLAENGNLYIVANRHLPYAAILKKLFGGFTIHNQNKKFIIYQCCKNHTSLK